MPIPEIRKLPCRLERLFDNNKSLPSFTYFNPSSAHPYIYVRATETVDTPELGTVHINHMFIYNYATDKMSMIGIPSEMLVPSYNVHQGIEDTRMVHHNNRLWFLSTSTHVSQSMQSEMMVGYYNKGITGIEFAQHLDFKTKPIKNVCPFVYKDTLCAVDMYTLTLYHIVPDPAAPVGTQRYVPVVAAKIRPCSAMAGHKVRGSTNPVHLHGNTWGCVVHDHIQRFPPTGAHAYISYWLEFDIDRCAVTFFSPPFYVCYFGIEFVSGIEYLAERDTVELYLGVKDEHPMVATTTLHDLRVGAATIKPSELSEIC